MRFPRVSLENEEACFRALLKLVHADGFRCPRCAARDGLHKHRDHSNGWQVQYQCEHCGLFFKVWTGTPLQQTHRPPSQILWIIKETMTETKSDLQLAQRLHCDRTSLVRFRRRIRAWVVSLFGPIKKV